MRFESVKAYAFGQLRNETLQLAPGMNVIYGRNEAGKSTWHAALYAGLCGMRRGRGRGRTEDNDFQARHKPWDGGGWEVGATIALKDCRVILRHDLDGGVDSSARDADLAGRDYSGEIMNEGAPDGARWLGLGRRSFLSTACVRQASILAVLDDPADLQDELQGAAATAGTGETAADALELLNAYRAEHVGTERAPTRPLAQSQRAAQSAQVSLASARSAHAEAAERRLRVEAVDAEVQGLEREMNATRAVLAEAAAGSAARRFARATTLSAAFPEGEPRHPADDSELAEKVMKAVEHWNSTPLPEDSEGPTVAELQGELAEMDFRLAIVIDAKASAAEKRLARARELSANFPDGAPRRPSEEDELTQEVARALATWDARPVVSGTPISELRRQLNEVDQELAGAPSGGLAALLRAIVQWLARLLGLTPRGSGPERSELAERRRGIEREIDDASRVEGAVTAIRNAALNAGLHDGSPEALVQSLRDWQRTRAEQMGKADDRLEGWEELQRLLGKQTLDEAEAETTDLRTEAESRAAVVDRNRLAGALAQPFDDAKLAELKERTSEVRRSETQNRLRMREARDVRSEEATLKRSEASLELREATLGIRSEALTSEEQESALRGWLGRRREVLAEDRRKLDDWEELQRLLGERTLTDLEEETRGLRSEADSLIASSVQGVIAEARAREPSKEGLDGLGANLQAARATRDKSLGELNEFESGLPDVADSEEQLERAVAEHARVQRLDQTLGTAITFLNAAQERVHRDIAPVLRATVLERLDQVTGGRYVDCRVAPDSLKVEVADEEGRWRTAGLLSHGTAEQLYLLLRLALARHLTKPWGEACPLILDDVVSAADGERKRQLLETLLSISESVQVILFTHEDDVRSWAEEHLTGPNQELTVLAGEPT